MLRSLLFTTLAALAAAMTGCCGVPVGCGTDCGNCDGYIADPCVPYRPFDHLREARRNWLCGNGCGEVYYGEWRNSPPDCCDPCDSAVQCTPPCAYRPYLFAGLLTGWYGKRYPRGWADECCDVCCLDDCCCDTGCGCGGEVIEGEVVESAGCASCMSSATRGVVTRSSINRTPARSNTRGYQMPEPYIQDVQTGSSSKTIRR